jgi:Glycosyl transferase family 2
MSLASTSIAACDRLNGRSKLAPVALFVYNRPDHTQRTVNSLQANDLALQSDLFVFSDGPKNEAGSAAVQQVRKYIRSIRGFKSVSIIERERNLGLANSVIRGVTELFTRFGRVIVIEDDLLTTVDFLTFMNQALERYEAELRIFSVSGFNLGLKGPEHYPCDAFCFYRSSSLGWGTWKSRWEQADWDMSEYESFCSDKQLQRLFNRGGDDLSDMLSLQMHGKIDSWAIRWAYAHFKQDALALLSLRSRVFHIGYDATATHSRRRAFKQPPLTGERKSEFLYPDSVRLEERFVLELQRSLRPSLARKVVRRILHGHLGLWTKQFGSGRSAPAETERSAASEENRSTSFD